MISFACCLYRPDVFERVCLPALEHQVREYGAEILTDSDDKGICHAYERMRLKAKYETVVYLHDDLELLDLDATERIVATMDEAGASLMGVVGSLDPVLPWWSDEYRTVGSWCWSDRSGKAIYQKHHGATQTEPYNGQRSTAAPFADAAIMDGIVLADRSGLPWPTFDGWHGYDAARCLQVAHNDGRVIVGDLMVCHHGQPHDADWMPALQPALERVREEWL